ncbi:hypothetical protein KC323_g178 [Hortaea werneckii]|nr:hypothetical protein KC323_g178 [Hortaea werneckii]
MSPKLPSSENLASVCRNRDALTSQKRPNGPRPSPLTANPYLPKLEIAVNGEASATSARRSRPRARSSLLPRNCRRAVIGWAPSEIERENVQLCLHASLPPLLVATFLIYLSNPSL